ncbi:hypothetical protein AU255_03060 [Methyloprofundus sedimenti]|uniref:Peptidase n=1 Tax=Methyloprofundus sedimenti TaxID=1420851 RepID=A0A1V8M5R9_9GAMM|nr:hypothetical protein [Methyloprofundus sedimenti]OQK16897.1 hypothetical protein AU255_03060 [Methyloprofundus sedimenti]
MRIKFLSSSLFLIVFTACTTKVVQAPKTVMLGSDRDAHACISSAGYRWCAVTQQCERPWELAKMQKFANTRSAFDKYCENPEQ